MGVYSNLAKKEFEEENNENQNLQLLNENTIATDKELNMLMTVDKSSTDNGFSKDPYFKIYNSSSYKTATKVIRIYYNKPNVCIHNGDKQNWKNINGKKLKEIDNFISKNWDKALLELSKVLDNKDVDYTKPDYTKLNQKG